MDSSVDESASRLWLETVQTGEQLPKIRRYVVLSSIGSKNPSASPCTVHACTVILQNIGKLYHSTSRKVQEHLNLLG